MRWIIFIAFFVNQFSYASETFTLKVLLDTETTNHKYSLTQAIITSYKCVLSVERQQQNYIEVTFNDKDCGIYKTLSVVKANQTAYRSIFLGWQDNYLTEVSQLNLEFLILQSREAFTQLTQFTNWDMDEFYSELKKKNRVVYRNANFKGHDVRVSIMKIEATDKGSEKYDSELEIAISIGQSGNYIFVVYGTDGQLSSSAEFPNRRLKAPMSCHMCHYDRKTETISRFF